MKVGHRRVVTEYQKARYERAVLIEQAPCLAAKGGCGAVAGERCKTPSGTYAPHPHVTRVREAGDLGFYKPE